MKIDSEKVKELREKTGAGILACKQALQKTSGDMEKAIDYLRAEGLARAAKREGKEAKEGLLRLLVDPAGKKAALLELNCETDFVMRTGEFLELADWLIKEIFRGGSEVLQRNDVQGRVKEVSGKTGEKIEARRALLWEKEGYIGGYLHHNSRVAVLVELTCPAPEVAREIAMQVTFSSPEYLSAEAIPASVQEREKDIFRAQVTDKPAPIREKIVEGKWRKRLTELCLLDLPYLRDPNINIRRYLERSGNDLKVKDFVRWSLGGSLG